MFDQVMAVTKPKPETCGPFLRRRAIGIMVSAAGLLAIVAAAVAVVPAPAFVLRSLVPANAEGMIANPDESVAAGRMTVAWRKLRSSYAQYGMAAALSRAPTAADDEATAVLEQLLRIKPTMLNQSELAHEPQQWVSLIAGLGYCDQMNAMAATALARSYGKAQLVALSDPEAGGHTVGRVWSSRLNDWLYFDLWAQVAVFRIDSAGAVVMLAEANPFPGDLDAVRPNTLRLYARAREGEVFNPYARTFGGYVARKLARGPGRVSERVRRLYGEARVAHVLGDLSRARALYAEVAREAPGTFVADAATAFLRRLRG